MWRNVEKFASRDKMNMEDRCITASIPFLIDGPILCMPAQLFQSLGEKVFMYVYRYNRLAVTRVTGPHGAECLGYLQGDEGLG